MADSARVRRRGDNRAGPRARRRLDRLRKQGVKVSICGVGGPLTAEDHDFVDQALAHIERRHARATTGEPHDDRA